MERTMLSGGNFQELPHGAFLKVTKGRTALGSTFMKGIVGTAVATLVVCANLFYLQANYADLGHGHSVEYRPHQQHHRMALPGSFESALSSPQQVSSHPSYRYTIPSRQSASMPPVDATMHVTQLAKPEPASSSFQPSPVLATPTSVHYVPTQVHAVLEGAGTHVPMVAYKVLLTLVVSYVILFCLLRYVRGNSGADGYEDIHVKPFVPQLSLIEDSDAKETPFFSSAITEATTSTCGPEVSKPLIGNSNAQDIAPYSGVLPLPVGSARPSVHEAQVSGSGAVSGTVSSCDRNQTGMVADSLPAFDKAAELAVKESPAATVFTLPVEQSKPSAFSREVAFTSQSCTLLSDSYLPSGQAASPLLCAGLHSAASSRGKPPGVVDSSLDRFSSPAPMAMDMLTPMRTPSPFPGFPTFNENRIVADELNTVDSADNGETKTAGQRISNSVNSWGSSAAGSSLSRNPSPGKGRLSHGSSPRDVSPTSLTQSICTVDASGFFTATCLDPCASDVIFCLDPLDDDGEELQAAQPEPVNAIQLDAKCKTPSSKLEPRKYSAGAYKTLHVPKWLKPHTSKLQDALTPTSYPERRGSDILRLCDLSASKSCSSGESTRGLTTPLQPITLPGSAEHTPSIAAEAYMVAYNLSLQTEGQTIEDSGHRGGRLFQSGGPWSSYAGDPYTVTRVETPDGLLKPRQEPARDYAAAAAAASVLVASIKQHAKALQLAAYAGDNHHLRSVQRELHATVSQLLAADLTPQAYTAVAGACKALAFTPAATPGKPAHVAVGKKLSSPTGKSVDDCRVASIGSRVVSGDDWSSIATSLPNAVPPAEKDDPRSAESISLGPEQQRPSLLSSSSTGENDTCNATFRFQPGVRSANPAACPDTSDDQSIPPYKKPRDGSDWSCGPKPLPFDVDTYLAARDPSASPMGHIVATLKSAVAFLDFANSNLINELTRKNDAQRACKESLGEHEYGGAGSTLATEETHPAAAGSSEQHDTSRKRHKDSHEPVVGTSKDNFSAGAGGGSSEARQQIVKQPTEAAEVSLNGYAGAADATAAIADVTPSPAVLRQVDRPRHRVTRWLRRRLTARTHENPESATGGAPLATSSPTRSGAMFLDAKRWPLQPGSPAATEPHALEGFSPIPVDDAKNEIMEQFAAPSLHTCGVASTPTVPCRERQLASAAVLTSHQALATSDKDAQSGELPVLTENAAETLAVCPPVSVEESEHGLQLETRATPRCSTPPTYRVPGGEEPVFFTFPVLDTLRLADGLGSSPVPETPQSSSASCGGDETEDKTGSKFMAGAICPSNTALSKVGRKNVFTGVAAAETPASRLH